MSHAFNDDIDILLDMRRHLSIVHHVPGRIRLRIGPGLWGLANKVDDNLLRKMLDRLEGIRDVRVNMAVASLVIEYDFKQIHPDNWVTLVRGNAEAAGDLLNQWLARNGQLLQNHLMEKE
jgi:hypothetical protein